MGGVGGCCVVIGICVYVYLCGMMEFSCSDRNHATSEMPPCTVAALQLLTTS